MLFNTLPLNATLQEALKRKGYAEATPIQFQTIEAFESGQHILGQSQTGSGKTAAFVLPLLNIVDTKMRKPQVLVICPTRELATQTEEEFYKLSFGMMGLKTCMANGGTSIRRQIEKINQGAQIIVGTPGRIQDLLEKRVLRTESIQYLVLDEADRMLDMGFVEEVEAIWDQLKNLKQVMSFSATVTDELNRILTRHLGDDIVRITTSTQIVVDAIDQSFSLTPHVHKFSQLMKYLTHHRGQKILIFAQTKQMTGDLAADLSAEGFPAFALHGDMDQRGRNRAIKEYKLRADSILVATDVASRGLNLNDIQLVINYDVPFDPESYVHRVGRTARAGKSGKAVTLITPAELKHLAAIERENKITIKHADHEGNELPRPEALDRAASGSGYQRGGRRPFRGGRSGGYRSGGGNGRGGYGGSSSYDRGDRSSGSRSGGYASGGERSFARSSYSSDERSSGSSFGGEKRSFARSSTYERPSNSGTSSYSRGEGRGGAGRYGSNNRSGGSSGGYSQGGGSRGGRRDFNKEGGSESRGSSEGRRSWR